MQTHPPAEKPFPEICALVSVTLTEGAEIDPDDADEGGNDTIAGSYGFVLNASDIANRETQEGEDPRIEVALDAFHDAIGIACLDNYNIETTIIPGPESTPDDTSWR